MFVAQKQHSKRKLNKYLNTSHGSLNLHRFRLAKAGGFMLRRIVGLSAGLGLLATSALAQSVSPPSPQFSWPTVGPWTGVYLGGGASVSKTNLNFRGGNSTMNLSDTTAPGVATLTYHPPLNHTLNATGTFLSAGVRLQLDQFVIGLDIDRHFGVRKSMTPGPSQLDGMFGVFTTGNFVNLGLNSFGGFELLGHTRGVFGVAVSPTVMIFGTAGVAHANLLRTGVSASGTVASSPSAPLVGAATVSRSSPDRHGPSFGFGMDVKVTDNLVARFEYIYDRFNFPLIGGAGFGGTIGELTTNTFISAGNPIYTINTLRASLNYRFGPADTTPQVASLTSKDSYGKWGGLYWGAGITHGSNTSELNGFDTLTITNNLTSTQVMSRRVHPTREGDIQYGHLLAGYYYQMPRSRWVFGAEYSHDFGAKFDYTRRQFDPDLSTGANFATPQGARFCGVFVSGAFTCIGGQFFGSYEVTDRLRGIVGYELLPRLLVFGAGGVSRGIGEFNSITMSGTVASSPSAPLVGAATVSRNFKRVIWGPTIGAGIQYKVFDHLSLRFEYMHDWASQKIRVGGVGFGGTIGDQTTNSFISSGDKQSFETSYWRASAIFQF
jgi:opacity protein-like surface antigen